MRWIWLRLATAALGLGAAVWWYRGPARPLVRGHLGDVAAALLVYALWWALRDALASRARGALGEDRSAAGAWGCAAATMAVCSLVEAGQMVWTGRGLAGELVVGSTFDLWDLVAYAVGALVAVGYERGGRAKRTPIAATPALSPQR